jgi:hypothetical protein
MVVPALAADPSLSAMLGDLSELIQSVRNSLDLAQVIRAAWGNCIPSVALIFDRLVLITGNPFDQAAPDSASGFTSLQLIRDYNHLMALIADASLALAMTSAFLRHQWMQSTQGQLRVRIMLPRFLLAVILIHFSLPLLQGAVDLSNALCKVVLLAGWTLDVRNLGDPQRDLGSGPGLPLIMTAALLVALTVFAISYFVRYSLLVVLAITAPLAALLFVLPETHRYAREWTTLFLSSLFMQPLQLLILMVGFRLETAAGDSLIRHGFVLGSIMVAFKVPGALHSAGSLGTRTTTMTKRHVGHILKAGGLWS